MNKLLLFVLFSVFTAYAGGICVKGIVKDRLVGKNIAFATVRDPKSGKGCLTDSLGRFELCEDKIAELEIRHTAYKSKRVAVSDLRTEERVVAIFLDEKVAEATEVEVTASSKTINQSLFTGAQTINQSDFLRLPSVLGEKDVIKALQLQAGVQSVSEGVNGLFVRGGSAGQNLFVLDGMELMNPSHLMGIYSVFNPLTTGALDVYKGNAPVELADHLSSTIIVRSEQPQKGNATFAGSIGNISSTLALKGISRDEKWSYVFGFRRSYLEVLQLLSSLFIKGDKNYFNHSRYNFYDANGLLQWHPTKTTSLALSYYSGQDYFRINDAKVNCNAGTDWGNRGACLSFQYSPVADCVVKHSIDYSSVYSSFDGELYENTLSFKSNYAKLQQKNEVIYQYKSHRLSAGVDFFFSTATPQNMVCYQPDDTIAKRMKFQNRGIVLYAGDNVRLRDNIELYGGVRFTANTAISQFSDSNSTNYSWAPVIALSIRLPKAQSVKIAFSQNTQQVHLCSFSSVPLPVDIWMNSTARLKPEISDQLTFGYYKTYSSWNYSIELYGKVLRNQLIYNLDLDNDANKRFEDNFYVGKGVAYGLDLSVHKTFGPLSADLNYSFARSFRSYPAIMSGEWFRDKNDRIHDLKLQVNRKLSHRWDCFLVWVYATGNTMTLPAGRWWMMGSVMNDYAGVNNIRLPAYHRLDIAANCRLNSKRLKESVLSLSLINVYNRSNPYFLRYRLEMNETQYNLKVKVAQISLFPIMPSVSWRFKF